MNTYVETEEYSIVETLIEKNMHIYVHGPTGCGKSVMARQACNKAGREFEEVSAHGGLRPDDFLGFWTAKDGKTEWVDGVLPRCANEGKVLIINEISSVHPAILFSLHLAMESDDPKVVITECNKKIKPKIGFAIFATDNTAGSGDVSGKYSGTRIMNQAFMDRFDGVLKVNYPNEKIEKEIILSHFPGELEGPEDVGLLTCMEFVGLVRAQEEKEDISIGISTRKIIQLISLIQLFGKKGIKTFISLALRLSILDKAPKEDRRALVEVAQRVWGDRIDINTLIAGEKIIE